MSSVDIFRWVHILGIILLCTGVGTLAAYFSLAEPRPKALRKLGFMLHGLGLTVILVAGFALLGQKGYMSPFPVWAMAKLGIWLLLGMITVVAKKTRNPGLVLVLLILMAGTAAYLGLMPKV